ncbi:hypothetical protein [Halorubrum sp. Atlit-26R]|nr:hypothetical protein [Halorubrum sp. Atlit-26R]
MVMDEGSAEGYKELPDAATGIGSAVAFVPCPTLINEIGRKIR